MPYLEMNGYSNSTSFSYISSRVVLLNSRETNTICLNCCFCFTKYILVLFTVCLQQLKKILLVLNFVTLGNYGLPVSLSWEERETKNKLVFISVLLCEVQVSMSGLGVHKKQASGFFLNMSVLSTCYRESPVHLNRESPQLKSRRETLRYCRHRNF